MKLNQLILPVIALGAGATFFLSGAEEAQGWSTIGGSLGLGQRDFRVFNNFSSASDNNNQTPDAQFPGYQGADMAIWKACVEWSSVAHGDGSGDPTQATIGSSGANFDPSFQGSATEVGGTNSNIHSQIAGSNGGVLAYCETPISNGWRIRYYEGWNWADGPSGINQNQIDLQSVACHEYGHGLGLGHSTVGNATMSASYSGGTGDRSISGDDQAGCQAVYGVISGSKPRITGLNINGTQMSISGSNFSGSGNEVWFTQAAIGGNGTPIKVTGVNSNGSSITVTVPLDAGPGDVMVRNNGTGNANLSNPWPSDMQTTGGCTDPVNFCAFLPNSIGSGAQIGFNGTASISANDLTLTCQGLPPGAVGIFFYGSNEGANLFGEGILCATGDIKRLTVQFADVLGTITRDLDVNAAPLNSGSGAAISGESKKFQFWYRDVPGGPNGFNTSDGLSVTWCD